jgi:hypothetical protein
MPAKGCTYRNNKVDVPADVRREVCCLVTELGSYVKVSAALTIAPTTVEEFISPGGVVQPRTLAKVRAALVALRKAV